MILCCWIWKRTGSASAMIFSASSRREIGVCPAGTFFSDLFCCSGASGCTQENSSGQIAASLCAAICCFAHS